ncbi:MAG TPA: CusA/CzcA family heavy metal efflux RND transporter [Flavilitoribacter sp.]|nr:CusA/CzcA family heavy metal efflux RND transporter [Flavilitoribacter sp.]
MLERIIQYSVRHKLIVLLFTAGIAGFGVFALTHIPIGAVPDVTNNQVQVITTSRNLATQDVEKFLTYPVELEMANLPGVREIRSISKFGLSVVTIVFEDNLGTYLPRQLIAEKIKSAQEKIPAGFGTPFMGPVSTGLGEIYQYIIDVDEEHKDKYTITDLRTIQDWIVRRQLSGIPGVVEVNTWGGYLKQYEVAVNPGQLRAMNISVSNVYAALEKNNNVAGGGYIEKVQESYFIRSDGLVSSIEDIENIVVANRDGVPVYIRDVGKVGYGHATRFGAITGNGEGEKVLGQVMMLKDADSKAVIDRVKARVDEISRSLPEGIRINAFLERSELIGKTTFTIAENLILGCLIVIFVVVLLLGNLRSGLVVASVIPLSLLFALSLMYVFGVDANLMSLGAIDFGIIIDGAVIIVEFIAFRITAEGGRLLKLDREQKQKHIDDITYDGATKMMRSAVFGQLIIIIVFIPILSLANVEGKMFKPMALVFCFALIGAMILCFTYIPVIASMFLKPSDPDKRTISSMLIRFLERAYRPTISWALRFKPLVLALGVAMLAAVAWLFSRMGGEFVPTLDEGDFVIQPVLKTGTSLSKTIELTTRMEQILKGFPEVEQVVSRIGAAEVPTDPMSMEESDVIIKLKPIKQWVSAVTKDELADKFKEALSIMPGIDYEFTQPIEMRFNELITGVRADLAVKIFGDDLDVLYKKALEVEKAIQDVDGASDITVEKVAGLPQMSVAYDRRKIAKYGLNIDDLNKVISMGFAGLPAGTVFEGEKQFDLVIRFDEEHRKDIENIETASVILPDGSQLPLSEFADITYTKGPAKISRDNTKRRIVVGVNVRNRDLESVVKDVQRIINEQIKLPVGYTISYGGQFENLRSARARLMVAVPIALVLIFVLLYFAFNSVKEALMIYSAIPLASVGGVLLLYLRGLPFSISAGVGFIALFGIAVLNGIVLIEHFKELKAHGVTNINKRIIMGTQQRLRPVLLTAAAAALGFLPMAVSTSAGAEVQRPLATVVVGGLITATALTLLILPVLYAIFDRKGHHPRKKRKAGMHLLLPLFLIPAMAGAQGGPVTLERAIEIGLRRNAGLKAASARIDQAQQLVNTAFDPDKTQVYFHYDQNNIAENGLPLKVWGLSQSIRFPSVYGAQKQVNRDQVALLDAQRGVQERRLKKEITGAWYEINYWQNVQRHYQYLDSIYTRFAAAAAKRFEVGETNYLEQLTAETKQKEIGLGLEQTRDQIANAYAALNQWLQSDSIYEIPYAPMQKLIMTAIDTIANPGVRYYQVAVESGKNALALEKKKLLPDLHLTLFRGSNNGPDAKGYAGFQAGISVPLMFGAQKARISAAETEVLALGHEADDYRNQLMSRYRALTAEINRLEKALAFYAENGKNLADGLVANAVKAYQNGEIDFFQYTQLLENAKTIEMNYLDNLHAYNRAVLEAEFILN